MADQWFYEEPWPFHWSKDGQSLLFTHRPGVYDGCFGPEANNGSDLYRLDLATGHVSQITARVGNWLALSPDETTLAYFSAWPVKLGLLNLDSGDERIFELEESSYRVPQIRYHLIWSPSRDALIYTWEIGSCNLEEDVTHSIVRVDANTGEQTTLIREDKRWLITLEWPTSERVVVLEDRSGLIYWMNPTTGELVAAE